MTDHPCSISVVTPTYNRADTLPRVFASLNRQTYRDFEWVIVDDGSTDGTHPIVQAWQARADFRIRYVWQRNQHKKAAINRGVREAHGQWLVALDSDDEMPPDALQIFRDEWEAIPPGQRERYVSVTGLCARPDGAIVGDRYPDSLHDGTALDMYFQHKVRGEKFSCMRTDVLRRFPYPEDVAGFVPESLVWWAVARAGYRQRFINRVVRIYHDSAESLTRGGVSGSNVQGLYLLAWDTLQHHMAMFRRRPKVFLMAAARYTRFRLYLERSGLPSAVSKYRLTNPSALALVWLLWPMGYALYRRDVRRQ
ncbi:glycosyl transferase family protein [Bordetella ansorpii]|uniref:Glycosyl transferase family protein n=1 Tax=Bordetella ansorpii TaxID=288768 RepID=A0A157S5R0_9BORD|nr:glycosyltransferase family A protein [Bordetella ansorpii]SAI65742.1 glycosyl transferase family protein [Bordetella ansorpii]